MANTNRFPLRRPGHKLFPLALLAGLSSSQHALAGLYNDMIGRTIQVSGNPTVYLVGNDARKHAIMDYNTYLACGLDKVPVGVYSQAQVDSIDTGEQIGSVALCLQYFKGRTDLSGQKVQHQGTNALYAIDAKGQKWQFPSAAMVTNCGFDSSPQKLLPAAEADAIPQTDWISDVSKCSGPYLGRKINYAKQAVQVPGDPSIYMVDVYGYKHHVYDMNVYNGCQISSVMQISAADRDAMATGKPLATATECLAAKGTGASVSGTIDPVQWMMTQKTSLPGFDTVKTQMLSPLVGLFTVTEASGPSLESGEVFKVAGRFTTPSGGSTDLAKKVSYVLKGVQKMFNLPNGANVEIGLSYANLEWDLAVEVFLTQSFQQTGSFIPANPVGVEPQFAIKSASTILHVKLPAGAPAISSEFAGNFYFKPTRNDPWMALRPVIELEGSVDGPSLTFGGELSGSCGNTISADTDPAKNCLGTWNLLNLGIAEANGGVLKVTLDPKASPVAVTGVEAAIANGKLKGPTSSVEVDGAVLMDVDASPGVGFTVAAGQSIDGAQAQQTLTNGAIDTAIKRLRITNRKALTLATLLRVLPISRYEPFNGLAKALEGLPAGMLPAGGTVLTVAPTGLKVGQIDLPGPTFQYQGVFEQLGVKQSLNMKLAGDIPKLIAGDFASALDTQFDVGVSFANLNDMVKSQISKVPELSPIVSSIMSQFTFDYAKLTSNPKSGTASSSIKFTIFGQVVNENIPLDVLFRPDRVVSFIGKQIEYKAADLGKVVLKGLETAAREVEKGGKVAVENVVTAAYAVDAAFKDFGNLIQGAFASSPNKWEKNRSAFGWQVHDDVTFRAMYGIPEDGYGWQYLVYWMNPLEKHFARGWSPWFDAEFYLDSYPWLMTGYCNPKKAEFQSAVTQGVYWYPTNHEEYDVDDGRNWSNCGADSYCPGLISRQTKYTKDQMYCAMDHWSRYGLAQGLVANKYFSAHYYYLKNPDVAAANATRGPAGAIQHYRDHGRRENRKAVAQRPADTYVGNWDPNRLNLPCRTLGDGVIYSGNWKISEESPFCEYYSLSGQRGISPVFEIPVSSTRTHILQDAIAAGPGVYTELTYAWDAYHMPHNTCVLWTGSGTNYGWLSDDKTTCNYIDATSHQPMKTSGYTVYVNGGTEWYAP